MSNGGEKGLMDHLKSNKMVNQLIKLWSSATDPFGSIVKYLINNFLTTYFPKLKGYVDDFVKVAKEIENAPGKIKKIIKIIKTIFKGFKCLLKCAKVIFEFLFQMFFNFASPICWITWAITILLLLVVFFNIIFGKFGSFKGELTMDFDKMQEMNQDKEAYTDLLNTAALREVFYDSISDTSFYQTFNLTDMGDAKTDAVTSIALAVANTLSPITNREYTAADLYASAKTTTGNIGDASIYNRGNIMATLAHLGVNAQYMDPRYAMTDANMNPVKYLIQAEALGTYSDQFGMTSYFRDYWGREEQYSLSSTLLYELNRWLYENDLKDSKEQIVYPEAFTQPVSYVKDYLRINTNQASSIYGEPYVYVTQRVTLDDIRNSRSEYAGRYDLEGLIKSSPSNLVYDYAIVDVNENDIELTTESAIQVNIGTATKYATINKTIYYSDGTFDTTKELMKLYWIVHPDYMDYHMSDYDKEITLGTVPTQYYLNSKQIYVSQKYEGPFYGMSISEDGKISFEGILYGNPLKTFETTKVYYNYTSTLPNNNTIYYGALAVSDNAFTPIGKAIDCNESLGLGGYIESKDYFIYNGQGYQYVGNVNVSITEAALDNLINSNNVISVDIVTAENNPEPRKHYQLAPITDEDGEIQISSRNLINKTYIETKKVRSVYRNSDEYWEGLADFIEMDLEKAGYIGTITNMINDEDWFGECAIQDGALVYVEGPGSVHEEPDNWSEKKCSIIKYYNQDSIASDFVADLKNWLQGESATMEIESESIYHILLAYEDYLIQNGTEGEEWEYRYYTNSSTEKDVNEIVFDDEKIKISDVILGGPLNAIFNAYKKSVGTDKERYKDTFDAVVQLNESRAISSEYTPVAVVTGTQGYPNEVDSSITNDYWGWKIVHDNGNYTLKRVYGETSLEFPDYYSEFDEKASVVLESLKKLTDEHFADKFDLNSTKVTSALNGLVGYFFGTGYADNIYGNVNFAYKWIKQNDGTYRLEYDEEALKDTLSVAFLKMDQLDIEFTDDVDLSDYDIRNTEEAWNPNAEIWRPVKTDSNTTVMEKCKTNQCGRITSQDNYDDYLAMELKSVRDYGLGSVLSYIEERKVVFKSGLAISEMYDTEGVRTWFREYYSTICGMKQGDGLTNQVNAAMQGFYPSALLNYELTGYGKLSDYIRSIDANNLNNTGDDIIKNFTPIQLKNIADGLNELQGTGKSIYSCTINGSTYYFTVTYATDIENPNTNSNNGFILMVKEGKNGNWQRTSINVIIPYVNNGWLSEALPCEDYLYTDENAYQEASNQFFNPKGYYLAWYDRTNQDSKLGEVILQVLNKNLINNYDNSVAQSLRKIINNSSIDNSTDVTNLNELAKKEGFKGAGKYSTSSIWTQFYNNVQKNIDDIDLIDDAKTTNVFLIEEAVTFLGNFVYTYDTQLVISGDMYGNDKIVSDIVFSDRYYVISNYIFALPVYYYPIEWGDQQYDSVKSVEISSNNIDTVINDTSVLGKIYANNPCFGYNQSKINDEVDWKTISDTLFSWIKNKYENEDKAEQGYCTSNYSYKLRTESVRHTTKYYNIVVSSTKTQSGLKTCMAKDRIQYYDSLRKYQSITNIDCEKNTETVVDSNGKETTKTTYTKTTTVYKAGNKVVDEDVYYTYDYYLDYQWSYKLGYTLKTSKADPEKIIYIDTYDEVARIYDYLLDKGLSENNSDYRSTASKLFIGMKIYNDLDKMGSNNKLDLLEGSHHNYTLVENNSYQNRSNQTDENMYGWCVKDGTTPTQCISASYGDNDWHYQTYNAVSEKTTSFGLFINTIFDGKTRNNDFKENLSARNGFLIGVDRYNNGLVLPTDKTDEWFRNHYKQIYLDEHGNIDDTNMDVGTDYVSMGEFELSLEDLQRITEAIHYVYGEDYTNEANVQFGEHPLVQPVTLSKTRDDFEWQKNLYGNPIYGEDSIYQTQNPIMCNGSQCVLSYWWTGDLLSANGGYSNEHLKTMVSSPNAYTYSSKLLTKYFLPGEIAGDYNLLFVGVDVGNRGEYGTPIPLYTYLYGNEKQITPVETGVYFNEEVYSSWRDRINTDTSLSNAKTKYILDYRKTTASYLYDYICSFETYIPLGVMSDDDLTYRGGNVYNAVNSNTNRNFEYTSSYMSVIETYLSTPEWENLIDNYNYLPTNISGFKELFQKIIPSSTNKAIDKTTMVQYIAGMIETIFEYAPHWTIDYYNSTREENKVKIEISDANYYAIENKLFESITVTSTDDKNCKTVTLRLEDGTYEDFEMLYLGYAGIYSSFTGKDRADYTTLDTQNTAPKSTEFKNVQLKINENTDERLDLEKSIEFMTIKFGKLLTKYGNISSATMAYFYGEVYWDIMMEVAKTEGISTGPEWHNDDPELVKIATVQTMSKVESGTKIHSDTMCAYEYNEETSSSVLTAEVVDFALSYITDAGERIELLRSNTSTIGSSIDSIGSKASEAKEMLERLESQSIDVVFVDKNKDEQVLTTVNLKDIKTLANKYDVDLGVFMAIIMSTSEGNPLHGIGTAQWNGEYYLIDQVTINSLQYHPIGLFGIENPQITTTDNIIESYNRSFYTYQSVCKKYEGSFSTDSNFCWVSDDVELSINSPTIIDPNWELNGGITTYNLSNNKDIVNELIEFFKNDGRFKNNGQDALKYALIRLSNIYAGYDQRDEAGNMIQRDALDTIYIYFNSVESLEELKEEASRFGYGSDWYGYYRKWKAFGNRNDSVSKALMYYDATMQESQYLDEIEYSTEYTNVSLNGKTIKKNIVDLFTGKEIVETRIYSGCEVNNTNAESNVLTTKTQKEIMTSSIATSSTRLKNYLLNEKGIVDAKIETMKFESTDPDATVKYSFTYKGLSKSDAQRVSNDYMTQLTNLRNSHKIEISDDEFAKVKNSFANAINNAATTTYWYQIVQFDVTDAVKEYGEAVVERSINVSMYASNLSAYNRVNYFTTTQLLDKDLTPVFAKLGSRYFANVKVKSTEKKPVSFSIPLINSTGNETDVIILNSPYKYTTPTKKTVLDKVTFAFTVLDKSVQSDSVDPYFVANFKVIRSPNIKNYSIIPVELSSESVESMVDNTTHTNVVWNGDCTYTYEYYGSATQNDERYKCNVKTIRKIDISSNWNLVVNGISASAISLFDNSSGYNEYRSDVLSSMYSGIYTYTKKSTMKDSEVDLFFNSVFASEEDFSITGEDFSILAFFTKFDDYLGNERVWIDIWDGKLNEGTKTPNDYQKYEIWDLPVVSSELCDGKIIKNQKLSILEHYGNSRNVINGGTMINSGVTIKTNRNNEVLSVVDGVVTSSGYNPILGNHIEITANEDQYYSGIISTINGERYKVKGMKVVYGYLLDKDQSGFEVSIGQKIYDGNTIGKSGNSGQTYGQQVYVALYLNIDVLDINDNVDYNTGWVSIDPEPYLTATLIP